MIKIADLMADLYEGNSDAQKNGFVEKLFKKAF